MDLISQTISVTNKTDLLEAIDDLFSDENLHQYPMNDLEFQDIFTILLNAYLKSKLKNRKAIFNNLTNQLEKLRQMKHRRSSFRVSSRISSTRMSGNQPETEGDYLLVWYSEKENSISFYVRIVALGSLFDSTTTQSSRHDSNWTDSATITHFSMNFDPMKIENTDSK